MTACWANVMAWCRALRWIGYGHRRPARPCNAEGLGGRSQAALAVKSPQHHFEYQQVLRELTFQSAGCAEKRGGSVLFISLKSSCTSFSSRVTLSSLILPTVQNDRPRQCESQKAGLHQQHIRKRRRSSFPWPLSPVTPTVASAELEQCECGESQQYSA